MSLPIHNFIKKEQEQEQNMKQSMGKENIYAPEIISKCWVDGTGFELPDPNLILPKDQSVER